jgi:hypothetical protein
MIVAVAACRPNGDTPTVMVVDTDKAPLDWKEAILWSVAYDKDVETKAGKMNAADFPPPPEDWETLKVAEVELPAMVGCATTVYYGRRLMELSQAIDDLLANYTPEEVLTAIQNHLVNEADQMVAPKEADLAVRNRQVAALLQPAIDQEMRKQN